jgi:putative transposase
MPNHVHMIVVPGDEDGLRRTVANAHRRYAARINARNKWTGHLWQGRYGSVVMDEEHLARAIACVSLNPVRAGLVERADDWRWSSVRAHLAGTDDRLTTVAPVLERTGDFAAFLDLPRDEEHYTTLRRAEAVGRALGSAAFLGGLEASLGRKVRQGKPGRRRKADNSANPTDLNRLLSP